jgi:hypothetical protein
VVTQKNGSAPSSGHARTKAELARHVGELHEPVGKLASRIVAPDEHERLRWTMQELRRTHQELHGEIEE